LRHQALPLRCLLPPSPAPPRPGPHKCAKRAATLCTRLGHQALPLRCLLPPSLAPPSPARVGVGRGGLHRAMPHAPITRDYAPLGGKLVTAVWGPRRSGDARAAQGPACASPPRHRAAALALRHCRRRTTTTADRD